MESTQSTIKAFQSQIQKTQDVIKVDLAKVRTGRASVSILDDVRVEYYGNLMPLNQVSALSTPDSRLIVIQPGGGGYGDCARRSRESLIADYLDGKMSAAKIERDFGIDIRTRPAAD